MVQRLSSSGDLDTLNFLRAHKSHVWYYDDCTVCGVEFSVNSRLLFRKPAMLHGVARASVPPDPDAPLATRHTLLLSHKPLPLYSLQSSIWRPIADASTDRVLTLPWCEVWSTVAGHPSHCTYSYPLALFRGRKPLMFTPRARGGYNCLLVTSLSKME